MLYDISLLKLFYVRTLNVLSGEKPSWFFLLYLCSSVSEISILLYFSVFSVSASNHSVIEYSVKEYCYRMLLS